MSRQGSLSHYVAEVLVIYPQGKRLTAEDSRQFHEELKQLIASAKHKKVLVNFENIDYVPSEMLGVLLRVNRTCRADEVRLVFCGFSPIVKEIVKLSGLERVLEIYAREPEALQAFEKKAGLFG